MDEIHGEVAEYDHSDIIWDYWKTGIGQDEMGVIQSSSGEYYVIVGDGMYTYAGLDFQAILYYNLKWDGINDFQN